LLHVEGPVIFAGDVRKVKFSWILDKYGRIDVVIGGPPCQDFSVVRGGHQKGTTVRRGKLYSHFLRAVKVLQPMIFIFENVPGLISVKRGVVYHKILDDFEKLTLRWSEVQKALAEDLNGRSSVPAKNYKVVFSSIVSFSDLGVPQQRRRLFIIGVREDIIDGYENEVSEILRNSLLGWNLFKKYPLTPIEVFEGNTLDKLGDIYTEIMREYDGIWEEVNTPIALEWKKKIWDSLTKEDIVQDYIISNSINEFDMREFRQAMKAHKSVLRTLGYYKRPVDSLEFEDNTHIVKESQSVVERMKHIPFGENYRFIYGTKWTVEGKGISFVYRRLHPLRPAPTVVGQGGGGTRGYHYRRSRATLTNRERARLQTFPDSFLFSGSPGKIRSQIGNAVPPWGSKQIAKTLIEILRILNV